MIFLPAIAVSRGVETMTGQNIGAGKLDRVSKTNRFAAKASFLLLASLGVLTFVFAPDIIRVFDNTPSVVSEGATFLRWIAPTFGFVGILRAYSGGFRGAGKTLTAATIAVVLFGFIRLPIAYVASQDVIPLDIWIFGAKTPEGIWLSFAVSGVIAAVVAAVWFERGTWRDGDLTGETATEEEQLSDETESTPDTPADD